MPVSQITSDPRTDGVTSAAMFRPSARKLAIRAHADAYADEYERWIGRNAYFHSDDVRYMQFLIPEGLRVLDCGCGAGRMLAALKPSYGIGVDLSAKMINQAPRKHPGLEFMVGDIEDPATVARIKGPFDVVVLSDTIGSLDDCQQALSNLQTICTEDTRVVIAFYSRHWDPILRLAEKIGFKMPQPEQNMLTPGDIDNLLVLSGYKVIKREWRQLVPRRLFGLGMLINRFIAPLPLIRRACLRNYVVAKIQRPPLERQPSVTVVVPCRNERGNVEEVVRRIPRSFGDLEILFVEGHSKDGTLEEIQRVIRAYPQYDIKVIVQDGVGKGDAVRKGFSLARGEVLMIVDADLTVPPEDLTKFYDALVSGKGEFINGSRLVYPMEKAAMRFLNFIANQIFSWLFSWLLNQRFTDTLCGTKVLYRRHYQRIAAARKYFGEFDPFGDFDLIFGASKLNLQVIEVPVRYASRKYGTTQISRFRHGWLLLRMVVFAFRKLKSL